MLIEKIVLREIKLPYLFHFETSFGRSYEKEALLIEVVADGVSGWGECVASEGPFYSYEDQHTAWHVLTHFVLPKVLGQRLEGPSDFEPLVSFVRGHPMALASLEAALWDAEARQRDIPLWKLLGGTREKIPCGVSIGIQDTPEELLERIARELASGYRKIKIKIKPGWDVSIVELVRKHHPDVPLMVDANSAYTLADLELFKALDRFNLLMIEQPLHYDDILEHRHLQSQISTPLCLDESIRHARDARHALEFGACRIINIKMGRVGGFGSAVAVHDVCRDAGVPVWCGGMLETGIGRAHNVALSTLENFSIPGDVSDSRRYFAHDTITSPIAVGADGQIVRPSGPGIGWEPDLDWIERITIRRHVATSGL